MLESTQTASPTLLLLIIIHPPHFSQLYFVSCNMFYAQPGLPQSWSDYFIISTYLRYILVEPQARFPRFRVFIMSDLSRLPCFSLRLLPSVYSIRRGRGVGGGGGWPLAFYTSPLQYQNLTKDVGTSLARPESLFTLTPPEYVLGTF